MPSTCKLGHDMGSWPHYQSCRTHRDKTFHSAESWGHLFLPAQSMTAHGLCGSALFQGVVTLSGLTSSSEEPPSAADGAGRLAPSVDEIESPLTPSSVSSSSFWTSLKLIDAMAAFLPARQENGKIVSSTQRKPKACI